MLIITPQCEIEAYYADTESHSQSQLKRLLKGIDEYGKTEDSSKEHFLIGGAVDCILTSEEGTFEKLYYVASAEKKPSEKVEKILWRVFEALSEKYQEYLEVIYTPVYEFRVEGDETVYKPAEVVEVKTFAEFVGPLINWHPIIVEACEVEEYQPNWGAQAKLKAVLLAGEVYFQDMMLSYGKKILSDTQWATVKSVVESLRTHPRTAKYFDRESIHADSSVDVYYQLPIYFTHRGLACKALLDIVIVFKGNDGTMQHIEPIDLKTMSGNTYEFPHSIREWRYDIQGAWYRLALIKHFNLTAEEYPLVSAFQFIVESTTRQGKPLVYKMDRELERIGALGRLKVTTASAELCVTENITLAKEVKGYEQLVDIVLFHQVNGWKEEEQIQRYDEKPIKVNWDGVVPYLE